MDPAQERVFRKSVLQRIADLEIAVQELREALGVNEKPVLGIPQPGLPDQPVADGVGGSVGGIQQNP